MKFRPFAEARDYVRSLKLKSAREWEEYCKTGNKSLDIPSNPNRKYISDIIFLYRFEMPVMMFLE